jgi:hypothetical protein
MQQTKTPPHKGGVFALVRRIRTNANNSLLESLSLSPMLWQRTLLHRQMFTLLRQNTV